MLPHQMHYCRMCSDPLPRRSAHWPWVCAGCWGAPGWLGATFGAGLSAGILLCLLAGCGPSPRPERGRLALPPQQPTCTSPAQPGCR